MEQFMKHFVHAILHAKPEDIVTSFDEDFDDDDVNEDFDEEHDFAKETSNHKTEKESDENASDHGTDDDMPEFLERATNVYRTEWDIVRPQILYKTILYSAGICAAATRSSTALPCAIVSIRWHFPRERTATESAYEP